MPARSASTKKRVTRRPKRSVRIHSMPSGSRVNVRYASSLKQGLEEFYKEFLKPKGYTNKKIVGNILLVSKGEANVEYEFRCYEEVVKK